MKMSSSSEESYKKSLWSNESRLPLDKWHRCRWKLHFQYSRLLSLYRNTTMKPLRHIEGLTSISSGSQKKLYACLNRKWIIISELSILWYYDQLRITSCNPLKRVDPIHCFFDHTAMHVYKLVMDIEKAVKCYWIVKVTWRSPKKLFILWPIS